VRDPTSGLTFDMTPLSNKDYTFNSTSGGSYTVHVCGPANNTCGSSVGGCATVNGVRQSIGLANSNLTYSDLSLSLTLSNGANCGGGGQRSTIMQFVCNPTAGVGQPVFVSDDGCTIVARWETNSACTTREQIPCVFTDPSSGFTYDLSGLAESDSNFYATDNSSRPLPSTLYAVSVCHSLLPGALTQSCNSSAGVCRVNEVAGGAVNFGSVSSLKVINGALVAQYTNGDLCGPNNVPASANVTFVCNQNLSPAGNLGTPVYNGEVYNCGYSFTWSTPAACPSRIAVGQNCIVTSPSTGQVINLNDLSAQSWSVPGLYGDKYTIRACAALDYECDGHWSNGVCQDSPAPSSFGLANSTVTVNDNVVSILYSGGSPCPTFAGQNRSALVTFYCVCEGTQQQGPTIASEYPNGCMTSFNWATSLVCSPDQLVTCGSSTATNPTFTTTTRPLYSTTTHRTAVPHSRGGKSSAAVVGAAVGTVLGVIVLGVLGYFLYRRFKSPAKLSIRYDNTISMSSTDAQNLFDDDENDAKEDETL